VGQSDWSENRFDFKEFEWDDNKAKINRKRHKIDFEDGAAIFRNTVVARPQAEGGEDRWIAIGATGWRELVVVFTEREGRCRLISARTATRQERKEYYAILSR
jgi:uncharacterized protein